MMLITINTVYTSLQCHPLTYWYSYYFHKYISPLGCIPVNM